MRTALLAALLLAPVLAGCASPPPPPGPAGPDPLAAVLDAARAFDGDRAKALVKAQLCATDACPQVRYRQPGTQGNQQVANWISAELQALGWTVDFEPFAAKVAGATVSARNVVAERAGASNRTLWLTAHYDTRPWADKDPESSKRHLPVPGANDGGSGVAVLLELARLLEDQPLNLTLRMVFFDAEDAGNPPEGGLSPWTQGSTWHASRVSPALAQRTLGFVLLDMVGDWKMELRREGFSVQDRNKPLHDDIWHMAARLGHGQFRNETSIPVTDDHVPFLRHFPAVDIIHLDGDADPFPSTHHTTRDDLENVSPRSLEAVGETVLASVLAWDRGLAPSGLK